MAENANFKDVVLHGHKWWILPETVTREVQVDISLWRNMDQNENQATHEIEILQSIRMTCEDLSKRPGKVSHGDLMSAVARKNPSKMSTLTLQTLCKFFVGFVENGAADLVEDLVDWHSCTVDPKALTVSTSYFTTLAQEEALRTCPHVRMYLVVTQYCEEKARSQAAGPSVSQFIEAGSILSLCRKTDMLHILENKFRELKTTYVPLLERTLGLRVAKLELAVWGRDRAWEC